MLYRINGREWRDTSTSEWNGGERYGDTGDIFYVERRGTVRDAKVGDTVEVKFIGERSGGRGAAPVVVASRLDVAEPDWVDVGGA